MFSFPIGAFVMAHPPGPARNVVAHHNISVLDQLTGRQQLPRRSDRVNSVYYFRRQNGFVRVREGLINLEICLASGAVSVIHFQNNSMGLGDAC